MDGSNNSFGDGSNRPPAYPPSYQGPLPPSYQPPPPQGYAPFFSIPSTYYPPGYQCNLPMQGSLPMQYPPHTGQMYFSGTNLAAQHTTTVGDDEVEVVNAPETSLPAIGKRGKTKLPNFTPPEDVCLVKGWLEISCDPVVGNGQKEDRFWDRVVVRYNSRRGEYTTRTNRSLQSRWNSNIKPQCTKFSSYYAAAVRENRSGMSDADKTSLACATFADIEGHSFAYMHCWEILKDEPKWQDPAAPEDDTESAGAAGGDTSLESNRINAAAGKRPIGRDRAKAASKRSKSSDTSSSDYASRMQDLSLQKLNMLQEESARKGERFQHLAAIDEKRYEELRCHNLSVLEIEKEKVALMREQHQAQALKQEKEEEERILSMNLDNCNPRQRLYYEALQEDIIEKINDRRKKRQGPGA